MGSCDVVIRYGEDAAAWLAAQKLPHPPVKVENRDATPEDVMWALRETGHDTAPHETTEDIERALRETGYDTSPLNSTGWVEWKFTPAGGFTARGDRLAAIRVLRKLAERCGQIWLYPDTGEPPIVIDESTDPDSIFRLHLSCSSAEDPWREFHENAYGTQPED